MVTDIMENITKTSPMDPDFIVQYTDITMLGTLQTVDFKALANSLLALVTRLEIVIKAIFSRESFMAMEPISTQTVTDLLVDLDLAKKLDVEFFIHMMEKQFQAVGEMTN
jgi:hypothetical protein